MMMMMILIHDDDDGDDDDDVCTGDLNTSSEYSMQKLSLVNFSQVIVENITVDNLNDIFNSIPSDHHHHHHPYALTLVFPFESFVPMLRNLDTDVAYQSIKMITYQENQFVTFLIPQIEGIQMAVSIYNKYDGVDDNGDRFLIPTLSFENLVFHSDIDEYFLFDLHKSLNWGKFSDSDDNELNKCAMRGSLLRIDTILQLIVQLWHGYISWTVQSITIHAALVELVGSVLREKLKGIPYSNGDNDDVPSWEDDFLNLLYIGRKLHGKFLEVNDIRDNLKSEIQHWELDPRRSVYAGAGGGGDDVASEGVNIITIAEDNLSLEFQTVANTIHQRLCDLSIDFDARLNDNSNSSVNSPSSHRIYDKYNSREGDGERQYSKAFDRYCIQDIWNSNLVVIERSVFDFFKTIHMSDYYTYDLQDYISSSSNVLYQFSIQDFRNFDWNRWWTMRDQCESLINENTSSLLNTVIACAASYMYDDSRDEKEMKGLALSIVGDVKASIENTI